MSSQRAEEQNRWRIAQGVFGRVSRESAREKICGSFRNDRRVGCIAINLEGEEE